MAKEHCFPMPSRYFMAVECTCGAVLPGQRSWDAWDTMARRHTGDRRDNHNPDRRDFTVEVLEVKDNGLLRTMEWCRRHGRTEFSVKQIATGRYRRCLLCDRSRQKLRKVA
jgi:hypothetical protein